MTRVRFIPLSLNDTVLNECILKLGIKWYSWCISTNSEGGAVVCFFVTSQDECRESEGKPQNPHLF
jgi:hypothetical protein